MASLFYISYNNIRIDNRYLSRKMVKKFLYRYRHLELCGIALILKKIKKKTDIARCICLHNVGFAYFLSASTTVKVEPLPGVLSICSSAPVNSRIRLTSAMPRPLPSVEWLVSPW